MTLSESPDPQATHVELTGPPAHVAMLVTRIAAEGRILYDTSTPPDERGDISRGIEVVTHQAPAADGGGRASVTVQAVLDVDAGVWPGLAAADAAMEQAVTSSLVRLDGVRRVDSRVVAVAALPPPRE